MFSVRDLETRDVAIHVSGDAGGRNSTGFFMRRCEKRIGVTMRGVEMQIYRSEAGKWRLVHVRYSEDRRPGP
jgi:hypothetical protein